MSSPLSKLDLNVLPEEYQRRRLSPKQAIRLLAVVTAIAVTVLLFQTTLEAMSQTSLLQRDLEYLDQRMKLQIVTNSNEQVKENTINEYTTISNKRGIITEDLKVIYSEANKLNIQVTSVTYDSKGMTVSCQDTAHPTYEDKVKLLEDYCTALKNTGRFSDAQYPTLGIPPPASVTIELKR